MEDTEALKNKGVKVESPGHTILVFDAIKLGMYQVFFGYRLIIKIRFFLKQWVVASTGDFIMLFWNVMVNFFNIYSFVLFVILSRQLDVNTILRENENINSYKLMEMYWEA